MFKSKYHAESALRFQSYSENTNPIKIRCQHVQASNGLGLQLQKTMAPKGKVWIWWHLNTSCSHFLFLKKLQKGFRDCSLQCSHILSANLGFFQTPPPHTFVNNCQHLADIIHPLSAFILPAFLQPPFKKEPFSTTILLICWLDINSQIPTYLALQNSSGPFPP